MKNSKGLGRGLDSLMPSNFDSSLLLDSTDRIQKLFISEISANPSQPRRSFDESALDELAASIKQYGVIQPIIVTPLQAGGYQITAGERRWRASKKAGLKQIPAIVRKPDELEKLEIGLIENVQRVDLSPIEQAISIEKLHQEFNMTYAAIAQRMGKAVPTLNNLVRLLQLPENAREALEHNKITEGHARAILALKPNEAAQTKLLLLIIAEGWSVRQAERYVTAQKQGAVTTQSARKKVETETKETKALGKLFETKVTLKRTAKGGALELHFTDDKDLERIIQKLSE